MRDTPAIIASGLPGNRDDAHRAGITMTAFMDVDSSSVVDSRLPSFGERVLIRRLLIIAAAVFVIVGAISRLELLYSHKFFDNTGTAQWIWQQNRLAQGDPAAFFATHEFDLPPNRSFTRIKMLGDPEYTLYFNGVAVGGRHVGDDNEALDTYDVSTLARDKKKPDGRGGAQRERCRRSDRRHRSD